MHAHHAHGYTAFYNSDFSGDVHLQKNGPGAGFTVPGRFLLSLVAEFIRLERISLIEQQSDAEVLGVPAVGVLKDGG
jgi:hypothetical protein